MYSFGAEDESSIVNIEAVNGVRFSRYFYAGVGLGLSRNFDDEAVFVPVYLDLKGFLPVSDKMDLVAGLDLGTRLDYTYETSGGLLLRPEFGLNFPFSENTALKVSLFYERYSFDVIINASEVGIHTNQFGLKLGVCF